MAHQSASWVLGAMIHPRTAMFIVILPFIVLASEGCAKSQAQARNDALTLTELNFVQAPDGIEFRGVAWLASGVKLVVAHWLIQGENSADSQLYELNLQEMTSKPLPLTPNPGCKFTGRRDPVTLSDGRVAYLEICLVPQPPRGPNDDMALMVYDPISETEERLVPYYVPPTTRDFTFAPDLQSGLLISGSLLHNRMHWLYPDRMEPLTLPVEIPWTVSWSPNGQTIAFVAVPEDRGKSGVDRLDLPRSLYLMSPHDLKLRPLAEGFVRAGHPVWSPDSRWILLQVASSLRDEDARLLLIEAATGKRYTLLSGGQKGSGVPVWLPDGRTIIKSAVFSPVDYQGRITGTNGLYVFELPDLDQYATTPTSAK